MLTCRTRQNAIEKRIEQTLKKFAAYKGFTLIELLVVVAMIAVLSGLLFPIFLQARDKARQRAAQETTLLSHTSVMDVGKSALPKGLSPLLNSVNLKMTLASSYHRIGIDVFTRYQVDCTGSVVFQHPEGKRGNVLLTIPFPDNTVEARDVDLQIRRSGSGENLPLRDVVYNKQGIFCTLEMEGSQPLTASIRFTALGRDQFNYSLPPARQLRSVSISLNLSGTDARTIPDDALQPSMVSAEHLQWEFKNLVSDRKITVLIPSAQAPLARVLLLSRLVAVAVLLFGAGFWYLSEQTQPGQLDRFRLGHFLLLALTYSLFFVIFAVLEFGGKFATPVSMMAAAIFSLPLLILHVTRVLNLRFALTRIVPLTFFTLGIVINGVYGTALRDYVFIGAIIFIIGYVTLSYQSWATARETYYQQQEAENAARRKTLIERITSGIGAQVADLIGSDAQADEYLKSPLKEELAAARARLERAREPVSELNKEYQEFQKRLPYTSDWSSEDYSSLERQAATFRNRLEPHLANLQTELTAYRSALTMLLPPLEEGAAHCLACGQGVPNAPFCPNCGAARAALLKCSQCGEQHIIPVHLMEADQRTRTLFCWNCGKRLPTLQTQSALPPANSQES